MLQLEHSYKAHKCKLTADSGHALGMVAGKACLCFGQYGQELFHQAQALLCVAGFYPPSPIPQSSVTTPTECKDVILCHLRWRLCGQLGFVRWRKHLHTICSHWFQLCPQADMHHLEHRSQSTSLFSFQNNSPQHCPQIDRHLILFVV